MSRQITILLEEGATLPTDMIAISTPISAPDDGECYIIATDYCSTIDASAAGFLLECLRIYHKEHECPYGVGAMDHERAEELRRIYPLLCDMLKEKPAASADPAEI